MATASYLTSPLLDAVPGIRHGFFTREGGVSEGLYASLNCGLGSGDDAAAVQENRRRVAESLGADTLRTLYQIHSATAFEIDTSSEGEPPEGDGLVTTAPGLAVGALSADCAPILFAARDGSMAAAAHAGWKGALGGIVESVVSRMEAAGCARDGIVAVVGPCIGQATYEVSEAFRAAFLEAEPGFAVFFVAGKPTHYQFDLPGFVQHRLHQAGVGIVGASSPDTYGDPARFFSYRRMTHKGETVYGLQISAICVSG